MRDRRFNRFGERNARRSNLSRRSRIGPTVAGVSAAVLIVLVFAFIKGKGNESAAPAPLAFPDNAPLAQPPSVPSAESSLPEPPEYRKTVELTLKSGENLFYLLRREGLSAPRIHELVQAASPVHDLGNLRQGQSCTVDYDERDGRVLRFQTRVGEEHRLVVSREGDALRAGKEALDFDVRLQVVTAAISDSLFLAAQEASLPASLTLALAEIFSWDIDFHTDIRRDDMLLAAFEEKYLEGDFAGYGRIVAALILNRGAPFWAFSFEGSDGQSDYYDLQGRSLRKAFLKSPLKYTRISSGYSRRRLHPILKIYRPHLGVDYAAPTGTPVRTIGDGGVAFVGWKGGYGRFIEVQHNATYSSTYGHLQRYARGIRKGERVTQGQVIGYVGSTGLSTGPHLDFRLLKNGRMINPLKVNFPDADPVSEDEMPDFQRHVEQLLAEMAGRQGLIQISDSILRKEVALRYQTGS